MNKTFRIVWNYARNAWAVTHEHAASHGKQTTTRRLLRAGLLLAAVLPAPTFANPVGPQVAHGTASFNTSGSTLSVTNSANAIINWQSFSIAASEITKFIQPSASSAVLNRVLGSDPSQILGQLQSNGKVFLVNPAGIVVGAGAKIDVGGLVASTLNISNEDFLAGRLKFTADALAGDVVNKGTITTGAGGTVVLAGANVSNEGLIKTPQGQTILAAGQTVHLEELGAPGLKVEITGSEGNATNLGQILAEAGDIGVVAAAVKNAGTLDTGSVVRAGGRIFLKATQSIQLDETSKVGADGTAGGSISLDAGFIAQGGRVSADGKTTGGSIALTTTGGASLAGEISAQGGSGGSGAGGQITLDIGTTVLHNTHSTLDASGASGGSIREIAGYQITSSATYRAIGSAGIGGQIDLSAPATKLLSVQIDASGASGGGRIRLGGEYQGGKGLASDELPNAETLAVSAGSVIRADATKVGAGGTAILWSDLHSALYADISAKPAGGGAGGFIELSSADQLSWGGTANAGLGGQVLMDPKNIVIQDAAAGNVQYNLVLGYNYLDLPRMKGQNLETNDYFGSAVSLSGTQLVVGAPNDDGPSNATGNSGAVYLFSNPFSSPSLAGVIGKGYTGTGNFNLTAIEAGDYFGSSVSLSGTQLAVGAVLDDGAGNLASNRGAVYLFNTPFGSPSLAGVIGKGYTGAGNYDVSALEVNDYFGSSVSLSGTQLAVGALHDAGAGNVASDSGAVYLFNTPFGTPSLSGVIGKGYTGAGNYDLSALAWGDGFGYSVSLSGSQLAVGAYLDDGAGNVVSNSGAVYLFNTPFGTPSLAGVIGKGYTGAGNYDLSTLEADDQFGSSVSLSGTQLAVGAYFDDGAGNVVSNSGAVYLFNTPFSTPGLSGVIGKGYTGAGNYDLSTLEADDQFGNSVSLSGTQLAVGAHLDDGAGNVVSRSGAVYLFNTPFATPSLAGVIGKGYSGTGNFDPGEALEANDAFGTSVSLSGTQLAVGVNWEDGAGNIANESGAVYLFNTPFTTPTLAGMIGKGYTGAGNYDLSSLTSSDYFGYSVSLSGTQLAVGAPGDDGAGNVAGGSGAVYLFNTPFSSPSLAGVIGKGYTGAGNYDLSALASSDYFGYSVSLSGTQLAVGSPYDDGAGNVAADSGAVYLFNTPFSTPSLSGVIGKGYTGAGNHDLSALAANDNFGTSVSLSGTQLAVGSPYDDGAGNVAADSGAVYLFNTPFGTPSLSGVIGKGYTGSGNYDLSALEVGDLFGYSVSISGTQLAVGAIFDAGAGNAASTSGAVYLFNTPFGTPSLSGVIGKGYTGSGNYDLSALEVGDLFGYSVSISGTQLAVGAKGDDGAGNAASTSGAVYLFTLSTGDAATGQTFAANPSADSTITPASITAILDTGSSLTLQANNDITVTNAIMANNFGGNGGALTLQAGRSILINANITTDNGNFTAIANERLSSGVVNADRDAGAANITMAGGTTIDAGSGNIVLAIRDGAGLTNNTAGSVTLGSLTANNWLVYAPNPASVTKNGITSDFRQYNTGYGGTINGAGNGFIYASTANLTVNTTLASGTASHTYGANPTAVWGYSLTSFADSEDNAGNVGVGGTASFSPVMASGTAVGSYTVGYLNGLSSSRGYGFVVGSGQAYSVTAAVTPSAGSTPPVATVLATIAPVIQTAIVATNSATTAVAPPARSSITTTAGLFANPLPLPPLDPLAATLTGQPTPTLPGGNIGGAPGTFGGGLGANITAGGNGEFRRPTVSTEFLNVNPLQSNPFPSSTPVAQCSS